MTGACAPQTCLSTDDSLKLLVSSGGEYNGRHGTLEEDVDDSCLTDDTVLDFVAGRLAEPARVSVERHLGQCLLCNRLIAVAAGYQNVAPAAAANDQGRTQETLVETPGGSLKVSTTGSLPAGTLLRDTYRLTRLVGRGGMGEVFEAAHTRLPGRFAVKVLHPHCLADPKAIVRFRREADITSALHHPNIVSIIDFDYTPEGAPFLVMEFLEGGELARVIADEAPLRLERVLSMVDQVASALTAVHRRGIVHRDLKPQNIFLERGEVGDEERVKLCDFGISKVRAASVALTGERVLLGTPQYMAPEQARGTGEVDARADQFSLAAIVYEMLTGRLAFPGDRLEVVVYRIIHEDPIPLEAPRGPALAAALARALSKDPAARFPTVQDFALALRDAATADRPANAPDIFARTTMRRETGDGPAFMTPPTPPLAPRVPQTVGRRRAVAASVTVALALATGAALVARTQSRAGTATTTAPPAPVLAAPERVPAPPRAPPTPVVAASPVPVTSPSEATTHATKHKRQASATTPADEARDERAPETHVRESKLGSLIDRL
jgi:eukaryotic-like serine/threonine-protein kinase